MATTICTPYEDGVDTPATSAHTTSPSVSGSLHSPASAAPVSDDIHELATIMSTVDGDLDKTIIAAKENNEDSLDDSTWIQKIDVSEFKAMANNNRVHEVRLLVIASSQLS